MPGATITNSGERSVATELDRGRMLPFAQPGGAKPIAARDRDAGHFVGWVGGVPRRAEPLHTISGADSGFRRTNGIHPRLRVSAMIRFAVRSLSGETDRGSDKVRRPGWHLLHRGAVPLPLIGEGLSAVETGRDFQCRALLTPLSTLHTPLCLLETYSPSAAS